MRARRIGFFVSFVMVGYVTFAGCGDEEKAVVDTADTGTDGAGGADSASVVDRASPPTDSASLIDTSSSADTSTADVVDARSPEFTGSICTAPTECYRDLDAQALKGTPVCLDKVTDGYCTHECLVDEDCCAVPGECRTTLKQVCSSFENAPKKYCFLSCEPADIAAANDAGLNDAGDNGNDYCVKNMSPELSCRSSGGGSENRKVCLPTGGSGDGGADDAGDAGDAADARDD